MIRQPPDTIATRGRPRRPDVDDRIRTATLALLAERGYAALSLESVAANAGVTRPTIYRRWPGKAALVTGVLTQTVPALNAHETDNALRDLCNMVVDLICAVTSSEYAPAVLALHAQARHDAELATHLRHSYLAPRASTLDRMIDRVIDQGHLNKSLPKDLVRDMLFGPPIYRWLVAGQPVDDHTARALVAAAVAGINQTGPGT